MISPTTEGSGTTVTVATPDHIPSKDNPIVGRVAFWTDDETSKVNVNTAGEGTFWDMPRFNSPDDMTLAYYQPAHGEYQRYPGHPAMVSLSTVLGAFSSTFSSAGGINYPESIYPFLPRLNIGGSVQGTGRPQCHDGRPAQSPAALRQCG